MIFSSIRQKLILNFISNFYKQTKEKDIFISIIPISYCYFICLIPGQKSRRQDFNKLNRLTLTAMFKLSEKEHGSKSTEKRVHP